jgi:branched-chain amino acid transport system substrate-binding protein
VVQRIHRRQWLAQALASGSAASAWTRAQAAPSENPIRFGQSVPLSGPTQHLGIEYRRGLLLAFQAANAEGGVGGRPIELISYDDRYEPEAAFANTRDLLEADRVFALVGYVGAESVDRCLPLALKAGLPFIAPLTGAESLRQRPPRALFHLRPGFAAETKLIAQALQTMRVSRTVVLVQDDADGVAGFDALLNALRGAGLPAPAASARVSRNATGQAEVSRAHDIQAAAQALGAAQPQALVCLAAHASTAAVLKKMRDGGFAGPCYATSLSGAAAIGPLLGARAAGLCVTQVVPSPFDPSRPLVAAYQQQLRNSGSPPPEYVSLEGWIVGSLLVQALRRMPRNAGRAELLSALEALGGLDLGGFVLRWDAAQRQVSSQVSLTVLDASGRPRR